MRLVVLVATIPLIALPVTASALNLCDALAKCAAIEGETERLACFDQVAALFEGDCTSPVPGAAAVGQDPNPGTSPDPLSGWTVTRETNPLDDSPVVLLSKVAEEGESSLQRPIILTLRCKSREAEAYINWGDYLGAGGTKYHDLQDAMERGFTSVTYRFGTTPAREGRWAASTDSRATFAPAPQDFIFDLLDVDTFVARTTPYNESPVTAVFDVSGLDAAVEPLLAACNLDPARREVVQVGPDPYVESVTMTLDTSEGLRACAEQPSASGAPSPLPIRVIIEVDGAVSKAWSLNAGFSGSDKLNDCIEGAIQAIEFEAPPDGRKIINFEWHHRGDE